MSTHLERLQHGLQKENLDALLLFSEVGRFYVSDFHSSAGCALIFPDQGYIFMDFRYIEVCRESVKGFEIRQMTAEEPLSDQIKSVLKAHNALRIGIEDSSMTVAEQTQWRSKIPRRRRLVPAASFIEGFRASKDPWEIQRMQKAQDIADHVFDELIGGVIREGMTEKELAAEITYRLLKHGADKTSFDPIVVSGPNSSKPHGVPGDRKLTAGDFITMDFGCKKDGYCSDMTRTVALGHATEEMRRIYAIVLEAKAAGIGAAHPGVEGREIHQAAARVIEEAGYGEYFGHGFGHGIGLETHESPGAGRLGTVSLPENAVISAEPGIYLPGKFGVRVEDVIVLQKDGIRNLMHAPQELIVL